MLLICFFGGRTLQLDAVICIKKQAELSIYIEPSLIIYFTMQQRFADAPGQPACFKIPISWTKSSGVDGETTTVREGKRSTTVRFGSVTKAR